MKTNTHFKHSVKALAVQQPQLIGAELTKRGIMLPSSNARFPQRFSIGWKVTCLGRRSTCSYRRPEQTSRVASVRRVNMRKDL
jgi:hypothetical protein